MMRYLILLALLFPLASFGAERALDWAPPAFNTDGTPLTDLAGFRIHVGSESGVYDEVYEIDDPAAATYDLTLSGADTYFIAMTAYDSDGDESVFSAEVTLSITVPEPPTSIVIRIILAGGSP